MDTASPEVGNAPEAAVVPDQAVGGAVEPTQAPDYLFQTDSGVGVTLEEARNGYLRQSDYTRKTQEIAAERQRLQNADALWTAIQEDPEGTLSLLQENLIGQQPQAFEQPSNDEDTRWQQVEQFMQAQRDREAANEVASELSRLSTQYGQFDHASLVQHALDYGIGNLEAALFHKRQLDTSAMTAAQQQAALDAKRNAPPIEGGSVAAGATTNEPKRTGPPASLREALKMSLQEHGLSEMPAIDF